ncbi:hypothetical protein [Streptomyces sp. NPDC056069]|uniref:hypothetical protein n=1 Tax=Streptomyces sp. NPDC056069 TaxID=3345702 RepID=UPI0035E0F26F
MVLNVDDVGASLVFATVTITRTSRTPSRPQQTVPATPWATAAPPPGLHHRTDPTATPPPHFPGDCV